MKALSIRQPWAWLIVKGFKDIENRQWPTKFRGRIYVHTGKTMDVNVPGMSVTEDWILDRLNNHQRFQYHLQPKVRGAIIGEVDIVDCVTTSDSCWFEGKYGFVLANPVAYEKPLPCKGMLGLFEVKNGQTQDIKSR